MGQHGWASILMAFVVSAKNYTCVNICKKVYMCVVQCAVNFNLDTTDLEKRQHETADLLKNDMILIINQIISKKTFITDSA